MSEDPAPDQEIASLADRAPGSDPVDPYEDVDVSELPDWWRARVEQFREHDLRPYRPPQFADEVLAPPLITALEEELDVDIRFMGFDVSFRDDWSLYVDGRFIRDIGRRREGAGYTKFELTANELIDAVAEAVGGDVDAERLVSSTARYRDYVDPEDP